MAALTTTQLCLGMEETFPAAGTTEEKLRFLVQYAILAPSVRNSQPWKFAVVDDAIELSVDRSRARRTTDPELRELIISCGAALQHLCIAARKFGYGLDIDRVVEDKPSRLAVVRLDGEKPPGDDDTILFYAIHKWLNVPQPFRARKRVPHELLDELGELANVDATWLYLARTAESRVPIAALVAEGDIAARHLEENRRKQLAQASHSKRRKSDKRSLFDAQKNAGFISNYFHSFLRRPPGDAAEQARKQKSLAEAEPVLAVLGTYENTPAAWLAAGEMLATVLLRSLAVGVRASFLNQAVEMPDLREKLVSSLKVTGYPQVLFRLGYPEAAQHARAPDADEVREEYI